MRSLAAGLCAVVLLSACGGADDDAPSAGAGSADAVATASRGTSEPAEDETGEPVGEGDVEAAGDRPRISVALSQRCESPAGFRISYPEGWAVNSGETVPGCTRFAPDPFTVAAGTDARVAAVTAWVRSTSFDRIASSDLPRVATRADLTLDGRKAARIERVSAGQGLFPAGVRITSYLVDLASRDEGPRTLVVNTVELPHFDYARNTAVLDAMMETIELGGS